ncbi:SDR family NAD(P)-dependent oxidoreductase [Cupriavidus basilensis]|uniref:SDR family NAD(P)-dependent oxidoreductase n=1 Tax=Cupriavidus basilensis TaxID=68895 RepID=UPI0023E8BED9|nr:SDR family NAD(P)-dependent oxidoreductase [Cupriavidus basilensis]MDF3882211.1 SDR family NAD(P)-dependent oxidoreductase [Cupriavidus basilensis]
MKLKGKVAIVTGGASGIGEATVRLFAAEGARVLIADRSALGKKLARELVENGYDAHDCEIDVSREDDVRNVIDQVVSRFGRLDIMVANAGIAHPSSPVEDVGIEQWQQMMDINLTGVFLSNKLAIAQMRKQGSGGAIVNMASVLGHVGMTGAASYNAAKGGVVNLTRSLGVAYAKHGIRVNAVCPGFVETPLIDRATGELRTRLVAAHPIGRLGQAAEVAKAVLFLASDDASFVVGTSLLVDGGYCAQ